MSVTLLLYYKNEYCEVKGSGDPGPFHIGLMTHAKEEEMSEDE